MLELPDLLQADCFYLEVCGKLRDASKEQEASQKVTRVRVAGSVAYLRLVEGGEKPVGHLHVDIALSKFFPRVRPQFNSTRRAISASVAAHYGRVVDALVFAQFVSSVEDIQSGVVFVGPSAVVSTINNTTIEVGGAHLLFRNDSFVRTIDWQIYKGDTVFVDISAKCETKVSPTYLTEIFDLLNEAYRTYIKGRTPSASA